MNSGGTDGDEKDDSEDLDGVVTPVSVGAQQIQQFDSVIGANARPRQPVKRRLVLASLASE